MIDDIARADAARVVSYAREHIYRPFGDVAADPPGDDPKHVARFNTFRAVFSITEDRARRQFRHLSVSIPSKKLPHPAAVFMLADLFGFTGWNDREPDKPSPTWQLNMSRAENCIVVLQELDT
jgi:hypothetical protein